MSKPAIWYPIHSNKRELRKLLVGKLISLGVNNKSLAHTEIGYLLNRRSAASVLDAVMSCRNRKDPIKWLRQTLGVDHV